MRGVQVSLMCLLTKVSRHVKEDQAWRWYRGVGECEWDLGLIGAGRAFGSQMAAAGLLMAGEGPPLGLAVYVLWGFHRLMWINGEKRQPAMHSCEHPNRWSVTVPFLPG